DALAGAENLRMLVDVRTRPVENFRYINLNDEFVTHHIDIAHTDSLLKWRIDKGERIALSTGKDIYTWIPSVKLGFHLSDTQNKDILGYMANLLSPRKIIEAELQNCINDKNTDYKVNKSDSDIILTVHAAAQGNFDNPYLLNSSITESDNVRRYIIDAVSKKLKSATVSVISGGKEIEVLKVVSINYGVYNEKSFMPDNEIKYIETEKSPGGLKDLSAEETASAVLNAFADWDETILDQVMIPEISEAVYREQYSGSKLISIGQSFTSGSGNTVFVPYTLRLRSGSVHRHNVALQKTDTGGWIVVGGL
ncbi:MAG: hypothetical protein K2L84_06325, partial [Muribaculaceae bacterium]|nr:hypothetical protein [Muribaculaceae bacterium]